MIEGNIDISHFNYWHRNLEYIFPDAVLSNIKLFDPEDAKRYNDKFFTVLLHRSIDEEKQKFFLEKFPKISNVSFCVQKMLPGMILPKHSDSYPFYLKTHTDSTINEVCRIIIFLEDWSPGHISEVDGDSHTKWKMGDWTCWVGDTLHMAANLGHADRYTLQITGTLIEN